MNKEFVCTVDGKKFDSEKELLAYMIDSYIEEVEPENDGIEDIEKYLEKEIPGFHFHVKKRPYTSDDTRWADENDPWFQGREIISVQITSDKYEMPGFYFTVKDNYPNDYHDSQNEFETIEEAIVFYKRFLFAAETFQKAVWNEINKYSDKVEKFIVTKIYQTYGTADSFNEYHFEYHYKNGVKNTGYIEMNTYDLQTDERLNKEIESYVKGIKGGFVTSVEGEVTRNSPKYCNDHSYWYEVDGISIESLARRAKKIRIEILEEN